MIQSKKARVVTGFHQSSLEIRKLELDYFLMVFDKLSTIASLLAGFASSALMVDIPRGRNPFIVTLFLISTSSALGSLLLVVVVATMCTMWGPGRALIGSDAKCMEEAVEILQERKDGMERFFFFGLVCYFTSSILAVWILFNQTEALFVTTIMGSMIAWMVWKSFIISSVLNPGGHVTGRVLFNPVVNVGDLMGDSRLDARNGISVGFADKI